MRALILIVIYFHFLQIFSSRKNSKIGWTSLFLFLSSLRHCHCPTIPKKAANVFFNCFRCANTSTTLSFNTSSRDSHEQDTNKWEFCFVFFFKWICRRFISIGLNKVAKCVLKSQTKIIFQFWKWQEQRQQPVVMLSLLFTLAALHAHTQVCINLWMIKISMKPTKKIKMKIFSLTRQACNFILIICNNRWKSEKN